MSITLLTSHEEVVAAMYLLQKAEQIAISDARMFKCNFTQLSLLRYPVNLHDTIYLVSDVARAQLWALRQEVLREEDQQQLINRRALLIGLGWDSGSLRPWVSPPYGGGGDRSKWGWRWRWWWRWWMWRRSGVEGGTNIPR